MLVIGTDVGAIPTLDPAALNARTVSELVSNLYDNLLRLDPDDPGRCSRAPLRT